MSAVNLETYSLSLLAAKEDVLSARRSTDWAVFTYEKRNDLKLADSGAGGLEELARKFTDNSLLYALCQVKDRNTGQSYIVLINWVGEKVDESYRQTCTAHLPAIKAFFKEASVIISTRRADEVTSEAIHNVLSSLSTASSASRKSRLTDSEELVGTNYRKTNPAMEMRRSKRDSFWAQAEREEEERKEEERRRLQDERKRWDRERMEQEKREADERDRKIREKEFMIEEQRKEQARIQGEERKKEKTKWEEQQKEHEEEMRDRFRRSESIEKAAEAAVLVSQRSLNPREFFRQRENSVSSSSSPSPTSPTVGGVRRPALRYQRSLTESSYMNRKPESPTSPSPTPSPSYTRRQEFFSSMSPRTPPETCSPSMIFSKAGAPTRGGRFPFVSAPRVGAQPPKPFTRADSLPATSLTHVASLRPASPTNSKGFSPTGLIRQERVSSPPPVRHEIVMPSSPPRVNSLSPTSPLRDIITPPASPPRTRVSPVSITKSTPPPLDTPTIDQSHLMTSSLIVDSPQPPSPLSPTNTPHPLIPQTKDSVPSITPNEVKSPPSAVSIREESLRDHVPTRALPASPSRTASAPLATSTTMEPGPTVPAYRAETPPLIVTRFEPIPENLQPSSDLTLDTTPQRSASPPRATSPTMEMLPSLSSLAAGGQSTVISTCYEPVMDVVTSRVESSLYTDPLRSQSPPVAVSPTSESVPSLSSLAAGSSSSAMSTRYELIPDDNKPSAEPSLHSSLLRSASPPRATSPTMASVYSLSSLATETTHSAILSIYDPTSNDVTARNERPFSASPPRATSPIFGAIRNETLVSLEDVADEEPAPRANTHQEESLIFESEYTTVETSPKHDIWLEETSMGLKVQPTALLEASVDDAKTSTVHTSITEDAHQNELFFCKDSFPGQDMDTLSAMLHVLPLYTAVNPEGTITNSVHSEDLSKAPGYRHAEDSEPETKSPWEELDDNTPYAGAIHTPEEPRVNGSRLNGIGGQDEEEAVHEEETGEKETQVEPGSAPKLCTRTVYEYHAEGDDRLSLDGGALIQPVDPRNEP